jgi:hypothetical protein
MRTNPHRLIYYLTPTSSIRKYHNSPRAPNTQFVPHFLALEGVLRKILVGYSNARKIYKR